MESLGLRMGLEMGSDETSNVGIEGEKIGIAYNDLALLLWVH
jgi:hypothetical protein